MSYSAVRANLAAAIDSATDDREEVVITRTGKDSVVLVALDDYESLLETAHVFQHPANARRLLDSIGRLEAGD